MVTASEGIILNCRIMHFKLLNPDGNRDANPPERELVMTIIEKEKHSQW